MNCYQSCKHVLYSVILFRGQQWQFLMLPSETMVPFVHLWSSVPASCILCVDENHWFRQIHSKELWKSLGSKVSYQMLLLGLRTCNSISCPERSASYSLFELVRGFGLGLLQLMSVSPFTGKSCDIYLSPEMPTGTGTLGIRSLKLGKTWLNYSALLTVAPAYLAGFASVWISGGLRHTRIDVEAVPLPVSSKEMISSQTCYLHPQPTHKGIITDIHDCVRYAVQTRIHFEGI